LSKHLKPCLVYHICIFQKNIATSDSQRGPGGAVWTTGGSLP